MEAQKRLFEIIRTQIPDQYRMADVIEELLGIGSDSVYRRIRGEKDLSFSELEKLCRHFRLSIDEVLNTTNAGQNVLFQHTSVNMEDQASYLYYIERLSTTLSALRNTEDCEMFFTAQDIPFYHFLRHTELLFFKLYVWHDVVSTERISFHTFCEQLDEKNILPVYERMHQSYMHIPSSDIWTNQTVDTILRLLDFYMETGAFDTKDTVLRLLNSLSELLDTVNVCAVSGHKGNKKQTPFALYVCSVDMENNFMLTRHGDRHVCTIKLYTVNSIATDSEAVCRETGKWINDLMLKSTLISGKTSERERFRFFQTAKNKVSELADKVEKIKWL